MCVSGTNFMCSLAVSFPFLPESDCQVEMWMEKRSFSYKYYIRNPHKVKETVPFLSIQRMPCHSALASENLPSCFFFCFCFFPAWSCWFYYCIVCARCFSCSLFRASESQVFFITWVEFTLVFGWNIPVL